MYALPATTLAGEFGLAQKITRDIRSATGVADVYVPQDVDYPSMHITFDRTTASRAFSPV
jgi:hypothetical protein